MDEYAEQADLDAWMVEPEYREYGDDDEPPPEPPADADQAERLLRRRRGLQATLGRITSVAEANIADIAAWRDDRTSGVARRIAQIEAVLEQWWRAVNRDDPRRKSERLPHGTVKLRSVANQYRTEVTDEAALLAWADAQGNPDLVKRTVKAGEVKKLVKAGPALDENPDPAGETRYAAVDAEGVAVPGFVLIRDNQDNFSVD